MKTDYYILSLENIDYRYLNSEKKNNAIKFHRIIEKVIESF